MASTPPALCFGTTPACRGAPSGRPHTEIGRGEGRIVVRAATRAAPTGQNPAYFGSTNAWYTAVSKASRSPPLENGTSWSISTRTIRLPGSTSYAVP